MAKGPSLSLETVLFSPVRSLNGGAGWTRLIWLLLDHEAPSPRLRGQVKPEQWAEERNCTCEATEGIGTGGLLLHVGLALRMLLAKILFVLLRVLSFLTIASSRDGRQE